jgi:hypothetical protein
MVAVAAKKKTMTGQCFFSRAMGEEGEEAAVAKKVDCSQTPI